MTEQNEQAPAVCPKCSATLIRGRDLPGSWRCGWEDYSSWEPVSPPLIGSSISELAAMAAFDSRAGPARPGERRE